MQHANQRTLTLIGCAALVAALVAMVAVGDFRPAPAAFVALALALGPSMRRRRC